MNPIYQAMGAMNTLGNMGKLISQFNQFRQAFRGDAGQQINYLVQSGQISQEQLNQAQAMAKQLGSAMGIFH